MSKKGAPIPGGYILLARQTLWSDVLMDTPPLYLKLWLWMLLKADHGGGKGKLKRGQFHTSINEMRDAMSYKIGYRKVRPTKRQIRRPYERFAKVSMIDTTKVTRGMIITIVNYDKYQDWRNYEGHNEGHNGGHAKVLVGAQDRQRIERITIKEKEKNSAFPDANAPIRANPSCETTQHKKTPQEFYLTKKKKKLTGRMLKGFEAFWTVFDWKKDKAKAADAWLETVTVDIIPQVIDGGKAYAEARQDIIDRGSSPKWAEGWIRGRRWEDELVGEAAEDGFAKARAKYAKNGNGG